MASEDVLSVGTTMGEIKASKSVGRRKQCKPVKVYVAENGFNDEDKITSPEDYAKINGNVLSESNSLISNGRQVQEKDFTDVSPLSENCQPIICPDCGKEVSTLTALEQHSKFFHMTEDLDASTCPTPYHQLARELQKSTASTQLEKIASTIDLDKLSSNVDESETELKKISLQTKRETVEKEDEKCSGVEKESHIISSQLNIQVESKGDQNIPPPTDPIINMNQQNQSFLDRVVEQEMAKQSPLFDIMRNSSKPSSPNPQQTFTAANDLATKLSLPDTEDFCNLCKKHFCNKYYLRKHKQDVHGISTEANGQVGVISASVNNDFLNLSVSDSKQSISTVNLITSSNLASSQKAKSSDPQFTDSFPSLMTNLPFGLPFSTDLSSSFLFPQTPISSQQSNFFNNPSTISNLASLMLLNPFASPLSLLKNSPLLQQSQSSSQTPSSLNTLTELHNFGLANSLVTDITSKNNPLYKFPITDQPASCDLCQKEFCNTYFLKVHKRDKHGIPLEESSNQISLKKPTANPKTTPAAIFSIDGVEPGENIIPMRNDDKNPYHFVNKRSEETCFLCKQQFSNRYSLMMHLLSSHNIKPEGFGLASELMQMELLNSSQLPFQKPSVGNLGSNKTSERVACNICNKEVCNKYFLKTHKLKVHGIQDGGTETTTVLAEYAKSLPSVNTTCSLVDSKNLHLDQLMQKYDEIAKHFTSSMPNDLNKKTLDTKMETLKKDLEVQGKKLSNPYTPLDTSFLKSITEKNDNFPGMFGALDMIAKNKFDYKMGDFQNLTNYSLLDLPQSFKNFSATAGKSKPTGFTKPLSGKDSKTTEENPTKFGYDPEAYCEICKKEFCSKYFLKTHKQKIHGVRFDGASDRKSPLLSSQNSNISSSFMSDQNLGLFPYDGPSNRAKEPLPSNMTRVPCEICGKELCNKYFLRTHMLKIHGISDASAVKYSSIELNKQETAINTLRRESPPMDSLNNDLFNTKHKFLQDVKSFQSKTSELLPTQNLVIGVKELKQVTEMLLQPSENGSTFEQAFDDVKNQSERNDLRNSLTNDLLKNDKQSEKEYNKELKMPGFLADIKDNSWKDEFSKLQNFMNTHHEPEQTMSRKRKMDSYDLENKIIKKLNLGFIEKENEISKARLIDLQNKFGFNPTIPEHVASENIEGFAKVENREGGTFQANNCILQPFEMQEKPSENAFAQCKVFLPVVQPICEPITLKFTVTPVDH